MNILNLFVFVKSCGYHRWFRAFIAGCSLLVQTAQENTMCLCGLFHVASNAEKRVCACDCFIQERELVEKLATVCFLVMKQLFSWEVDYGN